MDEITYYSYVKRQEDRDESSNKEEIGLHRGAEGIDNEAASSGARGCIDDLRGAKAIPDAILTIAGEVFREWSKIL